MHLLNKLLRRDGLSAQLLDASPPRIERLDHSETQLALDVLANEPFVTVEVSASVAQAMGVFEENALTASDEHDALCDAAERSLRFRRYE